MTANVARACKRNCWPAFDQRAGPAPPRQASRCSRALLRRLAGLTGAAPARRGLLTQVRQGGSASLQSRPARRSRRRPFYWPRCSARFRVWLAPANPEYGRPRRRSGSPPTSTTMRARRPVAQAGRCRRIRRPGPLQMGVVYFVFRPAVVTHCWLVRPWHICTKFDAFWLSRSFCALRNVARRYALGRHAIEWGGNLHSQKAFTKIPLPSEFKSTC